MPDEFLTTRWSLVLAARGDGAAAGAALEQLLRGVWKPLYAFARRWGASPEDAEDAVQGFMVSLLSRGSLEGVVVGRGKFRSFLLSGMRNHMSDVHSRETAAKRGGGARNFVPLDSHDVERGYMELAVETETPERAFERAWAMEVMNRARGHLADECHASGKAAVFAALFPDSGDMNDYSAISAKLGISEVALRSHAMRLRQRWRELIRAELAQTVTTREALDEEMHSLRSALL